MNSTGGSSPRWSISRTFVPLRNTCEVLSCGHVFVDATEPGGSARAYPPATLRRLAAVKARVDPANVFRSNHNIAPAPVGGGSTVAGGAPVGFAAESPGRNA